MKKNLFLILAAAAGLSATAQTTSPTGASSTSLDGKAFMVTLTSEGAGPSSDQDRREKMDRKENKSTSTSSSMSVSESDKDVKEGKKLIIRFENGMLRTTARGDLKVEDCRYNSSGGTSSGSGISFTADCNSSRPMKDRTDKESLGTGAGTSASPGNSSGTGTSSGTSSGDMNGVRISGTVNGEAINGKLSCMKKDGKETTWSFTGSTATKDDLENEGALGLK